jgi:hypothetical protein
MAIRWVREAPPWTAGVLEWGAPAKWNKRRLASAGFLTAWG